MAHGFGHVTRLFAVERARLAFADRAKAAMARADVAAQHESRRAIRPALKDVRATRFLTNRVQIQPFDQLQDVVLIRRIAQTNLQPFGLRLTRWLVLLITLSSRANDGLPLRVLVIDYSSTGISESAHAPSNFCDILRGISELYWSPTPCDLTTTSLRPQ